MATGPDGKCLLGAWEWDVIPVGLEGRITAAIRAAEEAMKERCVQRVAAAAAAYREVHNYPVAEALDQLRKEL